MTGVSIAAYTLWDKHAVDAAAQTPEVSEADGARRLAAAGAIVAGLVALALG